MVQSVQYLRPLSVVWSVVKQPMNTSVVPLDPPPSSRAQHQARGGGGGGEGGGEGLGAGAHLGE